MNTTVLLYAVQNTVASVAAKCGELMNPDTLSTTLADTLLQHETCASLLAQFYKYQLKGGSIVNTIQHPLAAVSRSRYSSQDNLHVPTRFQEWDSYRLLIRAPKSRIRYNVFSRGSLDSPALLLIHGFLSCSQAFIEITDSLSDQFRCIVVDLPGCGRHARRIQDDTELSLPSLVEDLKDIVDTLGYDKFSVAGVDTGGTIAWLLAMIYPENISCLVSISAPHPFVERQIIKSNFRFYWFYYFFLLKGLPEQFITAYKRDPRFPPSQTEEERPMSPMTLYVINEADQLVGNINIYRRQMGLFFNMPRAEPNLKVPVVMLWTQDGEYHSRDLYYDSIQYCKSSSKMAKEIECCLADIFTSRAREVALEIKMFHQRLSPPPKPPIAQRPSLRSRVFQSTYVPVAESTHRLVNRTWETFVGFSYDDADCDLF